MHSSSPTDHTSNVYLRREEVKIRQINKKEVHLVCDLFDQYRIFYRQSSDPGRCLEFLQERMDKEQSVIFVAESAHTEQVLGFAQLYFHFSSVNLRQNWILNDLFVRKEERNRGIGRLLLQHVFEYANTTKAVSLQLETATDNISAQKLYESFGFSRSSLSNQVVYYELPLRF